MTREERIEQIEQFASKCYEDGKRYSAFILFEVDDVKVYSFEDNGHTVYFTNSTGNTLYHHTRRIGKSTKTMEVECLCNQNN